MTLERELQEARDKIARSEFESQKLLEAAAAVLQSESFPIAARSVFDIAKDLTGAASGYVALLSKDGSENEVLFLDSGGLPCDVDESLPMPIRGLREVAYRENRPAYDNSFMSSDWMKFMPEGHVVLNNVIFGPLVIAGRAEGLIGLANKPSDFTDDDARLVMALSNLVAIGLKKSKIEEELRESQRKLADSVTELQLYTSLLRHDLANDLQLVVGEIGLAQTKSIESSQVIEALASIESAANRMMRLLQLFKQTEFTDEDDLYDILVFLVRENEDSYPNATIHLDEGLATEKIKIQGKMLMPFVFDNLVRNAVQHVGPNVTIQIHSSVEPDKVILDFVDNGQGIPEDVASVLFKKVDVRSKGGMGLYLCRKIVEIYKGTITLLDSGVYDTGAAFRIELPRNGNEIIEMGD